MFPSFYPPKKKGPASHPVASSLEYVYGEMTSSGHERIVAPEFVAGVDREVLEVIGRDVEALLAAPVTIGSLNFEEQVAPAVRQEVTESFLDYVYLGIDRPRRLDHAVAHEKSLKVSGLPSTDVHFLILNQLTDSERVFLPYVRIADSYGFYLWAESINYRFDLSSPFDPANRRIALPRIYGSDTADVIELKRSIGAVAADAFASGRLAEPGDVLELLLAYPGVISAKHSGKGVLIEHESTSKSLRLNALIFRDSFDGDMLQEKLAKLKRITREACEAEFRRVAQARAQRQWQRFGLLKSWVAPRFNLQFENHAPPEPFSNHGRAWARALSIDAQYGLSLERLGGTCERVGRRLAEVGGLLIDCLEDEEQTGGGCGNFEEIASRVRAAVAGTGAVDARLRRAVDSSRRTLGQSRGSRDEDRGLRHLAYQFHDAVRRVGRDLAELPGSIAEVIAAVRDFFAPSDATPKPKAASWFTDISRAVLHVDVWAWLGFVNPADTDDLREELEAYRAHRPNSPLERDCGHQTRGSEGPNIAQST